MPILKIAWSVFPNLSIVQLFKYVLASLLAKPEKLYAYTKTIKSESYYGWGALDEGGAAYYTTSPTPQENDILYIGKGDYYPTYTDDPSDLRHAEFEPVANVVYRGGSSEIEDYENEVTYERCIEADTTLPDRYDTVWVNDTTLTPGMVIYDNTGTYTDYRVQDVYAEGFKLDTVTITLVPYTGAGAWSGSYEGTVNNISFVSAENGYDGCTPDTFIVAKGQPCTIIAEKTNKGYGMALKDSAGNQVAYGDLVFKYTFTPTEDCTFQIGANIEK